ncbi:uncharacterized protein LOC135927432 [Gordionus sp. m RMFG-2023]|uniref:uncharacterized protein LOC135927432 n=1 Tax=Gordionus sp. m RMFG-2023 TaxID=3053472 RepID=UPI0031FD51D9
MKKNKEIIKKDNEFISAKIINNEIPIQNNSMTINSSIQSINNKMEEDNISYTYLDTSNRISTARSKKTRIDKKWRNKKKRDCNANIENIPNNKHIIFSDSDSETNESNLMQSMKIKNHVMISKPEFLKIDGNNVDTKKIDYKVIKELKNETSTNLLQKIANKEICHHRDQGFNKYRKQSHRDNPLKAYQKNESFVFKNIDVDKLPDIPITELDFECYEIILKDSEIDPKNNQDLTSNILQTTKKPNIVSKLPIIVDLDSPIIDPITEVPNIQKTPRLFDNSFNSQKNKTIYNKFAASNSHHGIQDIQKKITNKVTQNGHQENKQPPKAGDKIMYKILELDDHYNPIVSDFKEAIILEYDPSNNSVDLKHTSHTDSRRRGKFEIESDEEIFSNDMEIIKVEWERLIEPQLVH